MGMDRPIMIPKLRQPEANRYFLGIDHGGPGGDHSVEVVYDRLERRIVSFRRIAPEPPALPGKGEP